MIVKRIGVEYSHNNTNNKQRNPQHTHTFDVGYHIFLELGHTESIKSILLNHKCLTCISKIAIQKELHDHKLHQLKIKKFKCKRDLLMIYHKDKYHSELFEKFAYFAKSMVNGMLENIDR
jgi:DNA-binding transcriptional LysR family regulator